MPRLLTNLGDVALLFVVLLPLFFTRATAAMSFDSEELSSLVYSLSPADLYFETEYYQEVRDVVVTSRFSKENVYAVHKQIALGDEVYPLKEARLKLLFLCDSSSCSVTPNRLVDLVVLDPTLVDSYNFLKYYGMTSIEFLAVLDEMLERRCIDIQTNNGAKLIDFIVGFPPSREKTCLLVDMWKTTNTWFSSNYIALDMLRDHDDVLLNEFRYVLPVERPENFNGILFEYILDEIPNQGNLMIASSLTSRDTLLRKKTAIFLTLNRTDVWSSPSPIRHDLLMPSLAIIADFKCNEFRELKKAKLFSFDILAEYSNEFNAEEHSLLRKVYDLIRECDIEGSEDWLNHLFGEELLNFVSK